MVAQAAAMVGAGGLSIGGAAKRGGPHHRKISNSVVLREGALRFVTGFCLASLNITKRALWSVGP